jgi:hypothetical protein
MLRRKIAVIVIVFSCITGVGYKLDQGMRVARYSETINKPRDDISIVHTFDIPPFPIFRSREYVKIIRLQDNLEP